MKRILFLIVFIIGVSSSHAQENTTVFLGGGTNFLNSDASQYRFGNQDFGFNGGVFQPLWKKEKFNLGLNLSGAYNFANSDFKNLGEIIPVQPENGLTTETFSNKVNQTFTQIGLGPQFNFKLGNKFWLSPIVQAGLFNFKQDAISVSQQFITTNLNETREVFKQDPVNESGVFVKPALRLSYQFSNNWSIWGEGTYFFGKINSLQNVLVPTGESNELGQYNFQQLLSEKKFTPQKQTFSKTIPSVNVGVAYSFVANKKEKPNTPNSTNTTVLNNLTNNKPQDQNILEIIGVYPNQNHFMKIEEIKNFKWDVLGKQKLEPLYVVQIGTLSMNADKVLTETIILTKRLKSSNNFFVPEKEDCEVLNKSKASELWWKVIDVNNNVSSLPLSFVKSSCSMPLFAENIQIECLGYDSQNNSYKYKYCYDSKYGGPNSSADLTYSQLNTGISVHYVGNPTPITITNLTPSLSTQLGLPQNTVNYCLEFSIPSSMINNAIRVRQQSDNTSAFAGDICSAVTSPVSKLPICKCEDCNEASYQFNGSVTKQSNGVYSFNGNLSSNLQIYGVEIQFLSFNYTAVPNSCSNGVVNIENSGVFLRPTTEINNTNVNFFNENVSNNPNTNNNATKTIKLISQMPLTGSIPLNLTMGLPAEIDGIDNSCCKIEYNVCYKITIFYDQNSCKSCSTIKCVNFNNQ